MTLPFSTTFVDHTKYPSVKNNIQVGHLKAILAGKRGGRILIETIFYCLIKAPESKYSIDSFVLSFIEGSSPINDLCRNLTISLIPWQDHLRVLALEEAKIYGNNFNSLNAVVCSHLILAYTVRLAIINVAELKRNGCFSLPLLKNVVL